MKSHWKITVVVAGFAAFLVSGFIVNSKLNAVETKMFSGIEMVKVSTGNSGDYWIGKYEVTQKQFVEVMGENPSFFTGNPDNPVERIDLLTAVTFCNKLSEKAGLTPCYKIDGKKISMVPGAKGFRLPSGTEWEQACRAGSSTSYFWGDSADDKTVDQYAIYSKNSFEGKGQKHKDYGVHKVGSRKANALGIHDMSGNVWEWTLDWFGPSTFVSLERGGGWSNPAGYLKCDPVLLFDPEREILSLGFRLARDM